MTLVQAFAKLFPCTYRTRNGKEVILTGFAFKGYFKEMGPDRSCVWDDKMNLFIPSTIHTIDGKKLDLMELIESPMDEKRKKKGV